MLAVAANDGLLPPLSLRGAFLRVSLYADDVAVFSSLSRRKFK
jgi:hypothetical protein